MGYISLGSVADITKLAGFEFTKYIKYNENGEIIALRALNLRHGELDLSDIKRIDRSVSNSLTRSKLYKNDILLTYTGNGYGDCAIICENDKFHLAPNICKITPDVSKIHPYYLFSYIRSDEFYQQMSNFMVGSSQPTIPMKTIRILTIPLPDYSIQERIATIVFAIDEKIRINQKINNNLEQQAVALYEKHFPYTITDELPTDWHVGTIGDVVEIHDAKRIPLSGAQREKMEKRLYPYYGAASLMDYVDEYIFDGKYLLLGEDGTVMDNAGYPILQYVWGQFWVNNHAHILTGQLGHSVESLLLLFKRTPVKSIVTGAVQPKISQANLRSIQVVIPPQSELEAFNELIRPLFDQIRQNHDQNKVLVNLRDALLPKLMSGEIDVSAVQF